MANKKKDAEELLIELRRENDALKNRVAELEKELEEFKSDRVTIAETMAAAVQYRRNAEAEAEKLVNSLTHNAEKQAQAAIENAENEAVKIVEAAKAQAADIESEAKAKCDEQIRQTEEKTKEILGIARREADELKSHTDAINSTLMGAATELFNYITAYKDVYEKAAGKAFGILPVLPEIPAAAAIDTPASYDTPEQLYHTVMKIQGRVPDSEPLTSDMLGINDPHEQIDSVLNMGSSHVAEKHIEEAPAVGISTSDKSELAEAIQAVIPEVADEREKTEDASVAQDDNPADESNAAELESMLTMFMSEIDGDGDSSDDQGKAQVSDIPEISNEGDDEAAQVGGVTGTDSDGSGNGNLTGAAVQPEGSMENLDDFFNSLLGEKPAGTDSEA